MQTVKLCFSKIHVKPELQQLRWLPVEHTSFVCLCTSYTLDKPHRICHISTVSAAASGRYRLKINCLSILHSAKNKN